LAYERLSSAWASCPSRVERGLALRTEARRSRPGAAVGLILGEAARGGRGGPALETPACAACIAWLRASTLAVEASEAADRWSNSDCVTRAPGR